MIVTMIINTFPSEAANTYYIPPIAKKDSSSNKSIPARGKLISMWRNRQCQYKKLQFKVINETKTANNQSSEPGKIIFCINKCRNNFNFKYFVKKKKDALYFHRN